MLEGLAKKKLENLSTACKTRREKVQRVNREGWEAVFLESKLPLGVSIVGAWDLHTIYWGLKINSPLTSALRFKVHPSWLHLMSRKI